MENKREVIITGAADGKVRIYNANNFSNIACMGRAEDYFLTVMSVYATPDYFLFSDNYTEMRVFDLEKLNPIKNLVNNNANITAVLGDERRLFSVLANGHSEKGETFVYDAKTFNLEVRLCGGYSASIRNGNILIGYDDGYRGGIAVFESCNLFEKHMFPGYWWGKSITATKKHLIISREDGDVRAYRLDDLKFQGIILPEERRKFNESGLEHEEPRSSAPNDYWIIPSKFHESINPVSATDNLIALSYRDNKVRIYNEKFNQIKTIEEDSNRIHSLFMSNSLLITGSANGIVRVYSVPEIIKVKEIKDTDKAVLSVHTNKNEK